MKINKVIKTSMSLAAAMGTLALATSANAALALITPSSVVASSFSGASNQAINTINSSGLNAPFDETATHGTLNYWQGGVPGVGTTITFNLGSEYDLLGTWIWNYNNTDSSPRGMTVFDIYVGGSGDSAASTLLVDDAVIAQTSNGGVVSAEFEAIVASGVQYVKFVSEATGANDRVGLGEVRFEVVPEPTTTALLGLGGLALILRRRK